MDHGAVLENLQPYLDGQLVPDVEQGVRLHLEACADCRAELALLREVDEALRGWPTLPEPAGFSSRVMAAILADEVAESEIGVRGIGSAEAREVVHEIWLRVGWHGVLVGVVLLVTAVILIVSVRALPAYVQESGLDLWVLRGLAAIERQWHAVRMDARRTGFARGGFLASICFGTRGGYAPARYYCWVASSIALLAAAACVRVLARQWKRVAGAIGNLRLRT